MVLQLLEILINLKIQRKEKLFATLQLPHVVDVY